MLLKKMWKGTRDLLESFHLLIRYNSFPDLVSGIEMPYWLLVAVFSAQACLWLLFVNEDQNEEHCTCFICFVKIWLRLETKVWMTWWCFSSLSNYDFRMVHRWPLGFLDSINWVSKVKSYFKPLVGHIALEIDIHLVLSQLCHIEHLEPNSLANSLVAK